MEFDTEETVAQRPYGFYKYENEVNETVYVRPGHVYTFTALDLFGDGITDGGYYQILGTDERMIVSATRFTGRELQHTFLAPYPTFTASEDDSDTMGQQVTIQSSIVPSFMPSATPSSDTSLESSIDPNVGNQLHPSSDFSNDVGRLCIASGQFCQDNYSCCSLKCYSGFCLMDPPSRNQKDQRIHQGPVAGIHFGP
jgi:hypothetical protein